MGRSPCCDRVGLKKGPWTPEEDQKLLAHIEEHGHGSWRALPAKAGLQRCGKSCRLRWTNYLRPDIKRGKFSLQEEQTIIQLHALLGNRWSAIATHLPKRTDNEIKNYWNTHLKKRLAKMGIDPVTHKPSNDVLLSNDGQTKNGANLSHMTQWESARLEAEARLVRESKIRSRSFQQQHANSGLMVSSYSTTASKQLLGKSSDTASMPTQSLDVLRAWNQVNGNCSVAELESSTSTLTLSDNNVPPIIMPSGLGESSKTMTEFVGTSGSSEAGTVKGECEQDWKGYETSIHLDEYKDSLEQSMSFNSGLHDFTMSLEGSWSSDSLRASTAGGHVHLENLMIDGFTDLLLNSSDEQRVSDAGGSGSDYCEDSKNYWNCILNLINSPSDPPSSDQ